MSGVNPKKNIFSEPHKKNVEELKQVDESIKNLTIALAESENKYRFLTQCSTDIITIHTLDLKCTYVTDSVTRILGYTPEEMIGTSAFDYIHPDDLDYLKKRLENMLKRETIEFSQFRHKNKDGTYIWLEVAANYTLNEHGNAAGIITSSRDVSARKKSEDLLNKNQLLLKGFLDNTNSIVIIKNLEGQYIMVNKQFEKIHNLSQDQLIGKTVYDTLPTQLADIVTANDKIVIKEKKLIELEEVVVHQADGSLHTYLSGKFPILDENNNIYLICNVATDITEKKKHENDLTESKARLESTLENAISSIWSIDKDYKLSSYNKLCEKTFESINHLTLYSGMSMLDHLNSEEQNKWKTFYDRAFSGEHFSEEVTENIWDKVHCFDISFNPIRMHGKVEGVSVFARDITSRKKTEQQLNYKVNELNTFMYKATHDLRAPLASLTGLIKLAKDITEQPELRSYFEMIDTSINRMDKLLIDLFNIVNVTQGKLNVSVIDFEVIVDEIIDSLSNRPNFGEIIFRKKIKTDSLFFHSDSRLLYSVLQNIIDNAIKYKRESTLVEPIILITITVIDNVARISVSDNGIGIHSELQDKVFDMFYRATSVTNGTGLGLYIVKNTIEKLGGEVRLKSEENHGTSVFVTLPSLIE